MPFPGALYGIARSLAQEQAATIAQLSYNIPQNGKGLNVKVKAQ